MQNKIGKILFKKIFAWYVVVAFILTTLQIYSEYLTHEKALESSLQTTGKIFNKALTNAVWNLDEEQIKSNTEAIVALDNIVGVSILEMQKSVIAKTGDVANVDKVISYSFDLRKNEDTIAQVTLFSSSNLILKRMKSDVIVILINALIKSFILMLLVYYFSNKIITQTLHQLIKALNKINFSNKEHLNIEETDIVNDNEISVLIKSYNNMKDRIHNEIDKNGALSERVELALLGTNDGIWDWNIVDNSVYFSPRWKEMLGYSDNELPNEVATWADRIHPDDLDETWADIYRNVDGETEYYENIHRLRHRDASWVWMLDRGKTQYDEDGKAVRMIGTHTDITDEKEVQLKSYIQAQVIEQTHASVITTDLEGNIVTWNLGAQKLLGYSASEMIGKHVSILHEEKDIPEVLRSRDILMETGEYSADVSHVKKSGEIIYVSLSLSILKDDKGKPINFVGYAQDITKRKKIEKVLEEQHNTLRESQRIANIGSWKLNLVASELSWSEEIYRIFEVDLNTSPSYELFMEVIHPDDREEVNNAYSNSLENQEAYEITHRLLFKDGRVKYVREQCETTFDKEGKPLISIGSVQDITKQKLLEDELYEQKEVLNHLAHHDSLTQLPNRVLFNDRLTQMIQTSRREKSEFALLFLDLDHFKEINDSLGHDIGDEVLKLVTKRLREVMREEDTLARLGGDEFTIIMKNLVQGQDASLLAQKVLLVLAEPILIEEHKLYVSSSIGISLYPSDGNSASNLLKYADAAMYRAKDEGRNNFQFYSSEMTELAFERVVMETSLRAGIENEEFVVYYQPQVDGRRDKLIGMEALVRWQHPTMGLVSPAKFIPLAESTGLIIELDQFVMKSAMTQMKKWCEQGLEPGVLALNLAMKQLEQKDFISILSNIIKESGCKTKFIELEITESQIMVNPEEAINILNQINELGINLAIDDFGTGYSSLSYLKKLPISKLKIDQSFVRDLPDDEEDIAISKAVIALAKSLNLRIIAEGVETQVQKEFLVESGCSDIQGYFYAKPMPADEMEVVLQKGLV